MSLAQRNLLAQAVIIVAAVIGLWTIFVHPLRAELVELERIVAADDLDVTPEALASSIALESSQLKTNLLRYTIPSDMHDPSLLYSRVHTIAKHSNVALLGLTPAREDTDRSTARSIVSMRFTVDVQGQFADTVNFLRELTALDRVSRIAMLFVTPASSGEPGLLRTQAEVEVLRMMPTPAMLRFLNSEIVQENRP